ncbi:malonate decarboxylase holo-ACP synthase [Rhodoferax sp.]|uniref:malonate decarboxylase holo-ACP synthase n=1 Tax=Rhodoferax sp. TaxID=50421 RepID=UPI0028468CF2|nr:malonate decarboxylase holo-ACP synthase [Rhodoferax sp.]MDR3371513.1 malonate decarboxylase holo-ACP synthase [Rhodoferax sp.]
MCSTSSLRAHDLLWFDTSSSFQWAEPLPDWAVAVLREQRPAVVRRAVASSNEIAVGLRGYSRAQRLGGVLPKAAIVRVATPESLLQRLGAIDLTLPAIASLSTLRSSLADHYAWGPTGSVGFQLATGLPVVRVDSDLDIVMRFPQEPNRVEIAPLLRLFAELPVRCDVQMETPYGAVALAEWARGERRMLLKTARGPCLVANPWQCDEKEQP